MHSFSQHGYFSQTIGSKVSFKGVDGKMYSGVIVQVNRQQYLVKYDGYNFQAWLTSNQFTLQNSTTVTTSTNHLENNNPSEANSFAAITAYGEQNGWLGPIMQTKMNNYVARLSEQNKTQILALLLQAKTSSARFFALKSLVTGDSYPVVQNFINEMNNYSESYQQQHCLMTMHNSIIQQWEQSCSVTTVQTFAADLCPRYAWEIKKITNYDKVDATNPMAQQQNELLVKYGGSASARGTTNGKEIGINEPLNAIVGAILGVRFSAHQITEPMTQALASIRAQLDKGINTPLLIHFLNTNSRHFILAMRYKRTGNSYQYLIYDPWDGVCDYVPESNILNNSLSPLLTQWKVAIEYYYPAQ